MREKSYNVDVKYISKYYPKPRNQKEQNNKLDHIKLKKKLTWQNTLNK